MTKRKKREKKKKSDNQPRESKPVSVEAKKSDNQPRESKPVSVEAKKRFSPLKKIVTAISIVGVIVTIMASWSAYTKQRDLNAQLGRLYQTEINRFYSQFAVCLHWTLPLGQDADAKIDNVFRYNRDLADGIDLGAMNRGIVMYIFQKYDFAKPMKNYNGEHGFNPTGFNHVLGNLGRFEHQVEKHLEKYGNSASSEITSRLEYAQMIAKAETDSIRLDLNFHGALGEKTIEGIADFLLLLSSDLLWLQDKFGSSVYPVLIGKVLKSHPTEGSIVVIWEYGKY
jgi:hypothetical protein